jgi:type VI secretion system protein ImpL
MWLWILSALVLLLVWSAWLLLLAPGQPPVEGIPMSIPIAVTAFVALSLVGLMIYRRVRAVRSARGLETAIEGQAEEQALAANKPERVAEIRELHRQIQQGIASLKASKLGGGKRGADALYVLPWYVMVGPPGAGKTTALRHSGLVFPHLDASGAGVRGVGGTRNCSFWFTNEAILLDTAGRYATEADDHDEWMAFLGQLLKYRSDKPLNGVIVSVPVNALFDATVDQIQQTGRKIRARIDEMQSVLKMILPVYVLFTKTDLIAGFTEFFGDLKKSERAQAWGTTLRLDADKSAPEKLFDAEFDTLVERLHARTVKRMSFERSREAKEKIHRFPLGFAAIKRNLSDFIAAAFAPAAGSSLPILRGFYFTSGVQEGRPLDHVVENMRRKFGLSESLTEEQPAEKTESKSFFLRDVFMGVIFPDQDIAARSEAELLRLKVQRILVAAAALLVALLLLIPSAISYSKNRKLVADTGRISHEAADVDWSRPEIPPGDKVDKLDKLRKHTEQLEQYRQDPPLDMTFFMFQGDKLFDPILKQYIASLGKGFVRPTRKELEQKLANITGDDYLEGFNLLKTYLLLGDEYRSHLAEPGMAQWEAGRLTQAWAEALRRANPDLSEADLKAKLAPHVAYYVDLLRRGVIDGEPLDPARIERARDTLRRTGPVKEYYDRFVTTLIDQKYDENKPGMPDHPENLKYPPITLRGLFADRPKVLTKIKSSLRERTRRWAEVKGPYTYKGHQQVLASLADGVAVLEREKWVVPLTTEEKEHGEKLKQAIDRVRRDYDAEYIRQWLNFFRDIEVESPPSTKEAIVEFQILSTPDWPYQRLLRTLADNTQFDEIEEQNEAEAAQTADGGVIEQLGQRLQRKLKGTVKDGKLGGILQGPTGERSDPVPEKFRSMVRFGVPAPQPTPKDEKAPAPAPPVELGSYVGKLQDLAGEMSNIEDGPPNADTKNVTAKFEDAVKTTESQLLKMDDTGQDLMTPLLMNPLKRAYKAVVRHAGGAASGLWEVMVYPSYRDKIRDRYPFNLAAMRDASLPDAVAFFKPKDGVLWGFYEQYLKPFHTKQGHDFIPEAHLEERRRPANPFTPFNPNLYNCLKRADEITDALFSEGGDKPKIDFQINLKTVSPIVSDVIFELDGQRKVYRNERETWQNFTWPGPKPTGAKIQVRGAGGLDEEIMREGPWGLLRLFEAGTTTAQRDNDQVFQVTWQMAAPPVSVTMDVRPSRGNHPFPTSFFRATNCPPSIGQK